MSDIYMPEPRMQLVRDVRERREERTQTSDGPLLDELADALASTAAELRQERERAEGLMKLSRRWQEVINAPGFAEAVDAESRAYHDSACIYQSDLARARETIEKVRKSIRDHGISDNDCVVQIEYDLAAHEGTNE